MRVGSGRAAGRMGLDRAGAAAPLVVSLGTRVGYLDSARIWGVVDGILLIGKTGPEERYASAADLWLVDPATGDVRAEATEQFAGDRRFSHVAMRHDTCRLTGDGAGYCDPSPGVAVLDTATLASSPGRRPPPTRSTSAR